ncbi:MAG: heme exporter protein CcmD [Alphaproteobacteria bacterium]|nr:heme exporter protein CcmD [Alphaproteobacteria bacterium]
MAPIPDLSAGKYGAYIWPAYAITAAVFAILIAGALGHARRWKKKAEEATRK